MNYLEKVNYMYILEKVNDLLEEVIIEGSGKGTCAAERASRVTSAMRSASSGR